MKPTKVLLWPPQYEFKKEYDEFLKGFFLGVLIVQGLEEFKIIEP